MSILLSLSNTRETPHDDWFETNCYSRNYIQDIPDPSGGRTKKVLTAIPSPFARMHLFETAFEILNQEKSFHGDSVYHKLVSDCLDVIDLVFHWDLHIKSKAKLKILSWTQNISLTKLCKSADEAHKLVGETLKLFLEQDGVSSNFQYANTVYLLLLNDEVFAGTSPMTLFFTKPDVINLNLKKPNSGNINYFSSIVPIFDRSEEFQLYLHKMFKAIPQMQTIASQFFKYLMNTIPETEYILRNKINELRGSAYNISDLSREFKLFKDHYNNNFIICGQSIYTKSDDFIPSNNLKINSPKLPEILNNKPPLILEDFHNCSGEYDGSTKIPKKLSMPYDQRILPDNNFNYPYLVVSDFLEDTLISVEYPINKVKFVTANYDYPDGKGFLLPLKKEYLDFFELSDINNHLSISKIGDGYKVILTIPTMGGKTINFEKIYYDSPQDELFGKIINAKFSLALFPFFKIKDASHFNNYYKMMFIDDDLSPLYINQDYSLNFYCNNIDFKNDERSNYHFHRHVRVKKTEKYPASIYYEFNSYFDYLEITTPHEFNKGKAKGLIIPIWEEKKLGSKKYTFAVDFGTTNTNVAYTDDENYQKTPKNLSIGENDIQVVMFNAPNTTNNIGLTQKYEDVATFIRAAFIPRQQHEFIPSIVGEGNAPEYSFPIRTAVSEQKALDIVNIESLTLLSNINISFIYPKEGARDEETLSTDLKWSMKINPKNVARIEMFLSELLYIIRNKIILNDGNPADTRLIWSYPLSLDNYSQGRLQTIWNENTSKVLHTNNNPIKITESEAPFYFYDKKLNLGDDSNLCIDIGGGSTDVAFFKKKIPTFGTSFNFGGNAFWGSGFTQLTGDHSKIIQHYMNYIQEHDVLVNLPDHKKAQLNTIFNYIVSNKGNLRTEEIANIYFAWDKEIHFSELLRNDSKVRFMILFFYSSLMYHIFQIMKFANLNPPKFISFSGLGSKVLDILEKNEQKPLLKKFTIELVKRVFEIEDYSKVEFYTTELAKESTSYGCIFIQGNNRIEPKTLVYLGDFEPKDFTNNSSFTYQEIDDTIKNSVIKNVTNFIDMFIDINSKFSYKNNFGLDINLKNVSKIIHQDIDELFDKGVRYRKTKVEEDDSINETLFFYPLIGVLNELGNEWFTSNEEN